MQDTVYDSFLTNISKKFEAHINFIEAIYNFDHGIEFELALCKSLRAILPNNYGVCRGAIFSSDGNFAGDDIIIYDQLHFPTLRLLEDNTFAQKQRIPFEAVFAYIEAKNTICVDGECGNSFIKAYEQITAVKKLQREHTYSKYNRLNTWPKEANPIYTAIFSRGVRQKSGCKILSSEEAKHSLREKIYLINFNSKILNGGYSPDLFIADKNLLYIPTIDSSVESPHFIIGRSRLSSVTKNNLAYGIGLSLMFYAFDHMRLGKIHWPRIISSALDVPATNDIIR